MISKIAFAPFYKSCSKNISVNLRNNSFVVFNNKSDSVAFSGKSIQNEKLNLVVKEAFNKLAQNRFGNNLGTYMTRVANKETDIYLRETSLGKRANLTLSNGIFDSGKSFMNFVIDRASDKGVTVSALDDSISSDEAAKIVTTYLSDLK